ncbi:hypothetical protein GIB67_036813 [Kingdonia uniflora]|uniref:Homeobox domain-containing protein n=1 Tax=Kingdonia uniflora TaxID=39325 RepID=A0A7J7LX08_9MAGN|nr:hypothetical protein GIB67_036813 [Kingdonia uniflora]
MEEGMSGFCIKAGNGGGHGNNKCARWNPTIEQVTVLTDLFRSGLRTPTTDQIQNISSQLSFYGKIESKNVFYWFQNHKARERQKRRRISVSVIQDRGDPLTGLEGKSLSAKGFAEVDQVTETDRVIKTLQLFPLNTYVESECEAGKFRILRDNCKEVIGREFDYPPLDLRLSFL